MMLVAWRASREWTIFHCEDTDTRTRCGLAIPARRASFTRMPATATRWPTICARCRELVTRGLHERFTTEVV